MPEPNRLGALPFHPVNRWAWNFLRQSGFLELEPRQLAVLALAVRDDPEGLDAEQSLYRVGDLEGFSDLPLRFDPSEVAGDLPGLPLWFPREHPESGREQKFPEAALRFLNALAEYLDWQPKSWQEARRSAQSALLSLASDHSTSEYLR